MNNEADELEDTHLCIKCNATIVGLSKYIEHRKVNCLSKPGNGGATAAAGASGNTGAAVAEAATSASASSSSSSAVSASTSGRSNLEHSYDGFHFTEPEAPSSYLRKTAASHGGKSSKSPLTDGYEPSYDLGADLFFSSLQLQSVSTGGKTSARTGERVGPVKDEQNWPSTATCSADPLLKAVREQEESDFKPLKFVHSPEASDVEEEDDEEPDDFEGDEAEDEHDQEQEQEQDHDADEDEDRRHSPPAVPATHTGGKWRPEQRPQLHHHHHHHHHTHLARISPSWDEPAEELHDHPPAEHTHGKWVPGSKQLEYRENIDLTKLQSRSKPDEASYWCNICCRRLKTRPNYEQHLHSGYHRRRAEAERQLEQANLEGDKLLLLGKELQEEEEQPQQAEQLASKSAPPVPRQRRTNLLRCELCRHSMPRHLMGKHLISHYHYRRLQQPQTPLRRQRALHSILEHMASIVRQAPFQCLPCRFYANTESMFLAHWRSSGHLELTQRLGGQFWCSYCQFECSSNEQMWQHLLHATHKEVLFALNRSVPVCIAQRRPLSCSLCGASGFLYNLQLRRHYASEHEGLPAMGSASDEYQCRFRCAICGAAQRSRVALQRHEKHKHRLARYYCALCRLEFETPLQARRHRSLMQHRRHPSRPSRPSPSQPEQDIEHMLRQVLEPEPETSEQRIEANECSSCSICFVTPQALIEHRRAVHPQDNHACLSCGSCFQSAQALGRHTRSCQPIASSSSSAAAAAAASTPAWSCEQCSFSANYESDLLYHRIFHTRDVASGIGKDELLPCPLCPKSFRKHSLRAHLRNHTDERIFECDKCLAKFARRHNLKNHMASMHGERGAATKPAKKPDPGKRFQCGTCGKVLAKKYSLKQHELSHNETERRFRCNIENCTYAGLTPEALKTHLSSHAKGSHGCPHENCNYVGKSELHLKRHLKSHVSAGDQELSEGNSAGKWFSCDQCDFRARIKGHLRRHMLRHTGEKPHQCPHCEFQCSTIDNLRKHIVKTGKHPGKFIYECAACAEHKASSIFRTNTFREYQAHLATHK